MDDGLSVKHGEDFEFHCVLVVTQAIEYCRWYVPVVKEVCIQTSSYIRNVIY